LLSRTWRKVKRDVAVGDVVYMLEKDDDDEFCRMGIVEEVKEGSDGHIRTATVKYTNPGGDPQSRSPPKLAVRPIHKLAVIVPAGYRFEEDVTMEQAGPQRIAGPGKERKEPTVSRHGPSPEQSGLENRPRREAAQKAMDALKKGAQATRGRGHRRGRMYHRAGAINERN